MRRLTSKGDSNTSNPATRAVPEVGGKKPVSIRIVVVLPAPLGPRNPSTSPALSSKLSAFTAARSR